ncbi:hypothetical protein, partial [uncultured Desulfovibrio sp.]
MWLLAWDVTGRAMPRSSVRNSPALLSIRQRADSGRGRGAPPRSGKNGAVVSLPARTQRMKFVACHGSGVGGMMPAALPAA